MSNSSVLASIREKGNQWKKEIDMLEVIAKRKPFRGIITNYRVAHEGEEASPLGRIIGFLGDKMIMTSPIVKMGEYMVETENSTYYLEKKR